MKKTWQIVVALFCVAAMTAGCANMSARQKGFLKGAAVGAVVGGGGGAAIGNGSDRGNRDAATGTGAIIGAASGALVGGVIGALMAKEEVPPPKPVPPPPAPVEVTPPPPPPVETPPPPVVKEKIVLRGINFDFDKSNIKKEFVPVLDQAVEILKANPGLKVVVEGYCDWIGTDAYNLKLSKRRANSVKQFLVKHGIGADRLSTIGYGKTHFIADNRTAEGRAMNRRVEFKILNE
ncbi:MAG: OmpA family protein [Desulfobacteraceae bacterium]|nr:OmpA family protein [Desulfobacteraceae bacterium]